MKLTMQLRNEATELSSASRGKTGRLRLTLYGVGFLLNRVSLYIRKTTSLAGSSGIVKSSPERVDVKDSTNVSQSLKARRNSRSWAYCPCQINLFVIGGGGLHFSHGLSLFCLRSFRNNAVFL